MLQAMLKQKLLVVDSQDEVISLKLELLVSALEQSTVLLDKPWAHLSKFKLSIFTSTFLTLFCFLLRLVLFFVQQ